MMNEDTMEWMDRPGDDSNVHPRKKKENQILLRRFLNWERVGDKTVEGVEHSSSLHID